MLEIVNRHRWAPLVDQIVKQTQTTMQAQAASKQAINTARQIQVSRTIQAPTQRLRPILPSIRLLSKCYMPVSPIKL